MVFSNKTTFTNICTANFLLFKQMIHDIGYTFSAGQTHEQNRLNSQIIITIHFTHYIKQRQHIYNLLFEMNLKTAICSEVSCITTHYAKFSVTIRADTVTSSTIIIFWGNLKIQHIISVAHSQIISFHECFLSNKLIFTDLIKVQ